MNCWALTDKGKIRKQNQDAFYAIADEEKRVALLVVCDGMGGAKAGNIESKMAVEYFTEEVKKKFEDNHTLNSMKRVMQEAAQKANRDVYECSALNYDYEGMGTTLVAALVKGEECVVLNIGDSRAYHITRVSIKRITRDHSVIEDMIERGEVTREESRRHPQKNLITRAIGTSFNIEGDVFSVDLQDGEYILLCSDGLTNTVSEQEIMNEVLSGGTLEEACNSLLSISLMRGAPDNVTIVLFQK